MACSGDRQHKASWWQECQALTRTEDRSRPCRSSYFARVSANQWMALTPPELVEAHLNLDQRTMTALRKDKPVIVA